MKSSHTPPRIAGKVFGDSERASSCLTFDARPVTPEEVRRYRKSYFAEPGARIAHPGLINDLKQIDPLTKHGVSTSGSHHVPDVLANAPATEYQRMQQQRSESTYASLKREPLGRSYSRGHTLPAHMTKPEYAFGISGTFGESAKELLYPSTTLNNKQDDELYKRSHGAVAPGEQKNRQYQWDNAKIDPAKYRFGVKTISLGSDGLGAATCLRPEIDENANKPVVTVKQVEEMRSTYDQLGKPRHVSAAATNLPSDHVFGVKLSKDDETARGCIQGYYTEDEQQPDADLGRPVSYGWHNVTPETRSFGVPSIRSDIPMPSRRSIADCQNYGDDSSSKELLYPEEFASSGIQDSEFAVPRDKTQLRAMFEQIGYKVSDEYFALVWKDTSKSHPNAASLVAFRDALNRFLAAEDMGQSALEVATASRKCTLTPIHITKQIKSIFHRTHHSHGLEIYRREHAEVAADGVDADPVALGVALPEPHGAVVARGREHRARDVPLDAPHFRVVVMLERHFFHVALQRVLHLELPDAHCAVLARRRHEVVRAPHVGRPTHVVDRVRVALELCDDLPATVRVVVAPDFDHVAVAAHDDHGRLEARLVPRDARHAFLVGEELLLQRPVREIHHVDRLVHAHKAVFRRRGSRRPRWRGANLTSCTDSRESTSCAWFRQVSRLAGTLLAWTPPLSGRPWSSQMETVRSKEHEARIWPNSGCAQAIFQTLAWCAFHSHCGFHSPAISSQILILRSDEHVARRVP